jgi:hypothetical protein
MITFRLSRSTHFIEQNGLFLTHNEMPDDKGAHSRAIEMATTA